MSGLRARLIAELTQRPHQSARQLARRLDAERRQVNRCLYSDPSRFVSAGHTPPMWTLTREARDDRADAADVKQARTAARPLDDVADLEAAIDETIEISEELWSVEQRKGGRRIDRHLRDLKARTKRLESQLRSDSGTVPIQRLRDAVNALQRAIDDAENETKVQLGPADIARALGPLQSYDDDL